MQFNEERQWYNEKICDIEELSIFRDKKLAVYKENDLKTLKKIDSTKTFSQCEIASGNILVISPEEPKEFLINKKDSLIEITIKPKAI